MSHARVLRPVALSLFAIIAVAAVSQRYLAASVPMTVCPNGVIVYTPPCPSVGSKGIGACSVNGACSPLTGDECGVKKGIWFGETSKCAMSCRVTAYPGHNSVPFQVLEARLGISDYSYSYHPLTMAQWSWSILNASGQAVSAGTAAPLLNYPLVVNGTVQLPEGAYNPGRSYATTPNGFPYVVAVEGRDQFGRTCGKTTSSPVTPPGLAVPPTGLATSTASGLTLSWKPIDPTSYAFWGYKVLRASSSAGPWTEVASRLTTTSHTFPAGSLGGAVHLAVASQNQTGVGPMSAPISVNLPPTVPAGVTATTATTSTATNGIVDLTWSPSIGASSYAVRISSGGAAYTTSQTVSATKATLSGLTVGTMYSIVVVANGSAGASAPSAPVTWLAKKYLPD